MIIKGNRKRTRLTNGKEPLRDTDLSVDTGYMSYQTVPLPLKKDKKFTQAWDYLPKDDIPKQILRQKGLAKTNKQKLKHIKSHQKQKHEKQRSNQLFQQGIKINQTNGSY
jgi:hypothetical protein